MTGVEISVPDDAGVFLAVSAQNYADADTAFWVLKDVLGKKLPSPGEQAHLDQLRQRRKETYADLVTWVLSVEAVRLGASSVEVTPVTSARGGEPHA